MRYEMRMPDLTTTGSDMRVIRWHVKPEESVRRGMPLVEVETDKAVMDVECVVDGVMSEAMAQVNGAVQAGQVIAVFEVVDVTSVRPVAPAGQAPDAGKGMFARNRAARNAPVAGNAGKPDSSVRPMTIPHRIAVRRLVQSKQQVPHFYLQSSVNAAAMIKRRKAAEPDKAAWDAFFAWALHRAISKFDLMAYRAEGETLVRQQSDSIGVAVDHEGDLFVVPVTPADKSPEEVSAELRGLIDRLRNNDSEAKRIRPSVMTVTNLGALGVESFVPIINPPESAILGVGRVMPIPVGRSEGRIAIEQRASLTLSVDHRVVSGKYAAEFLSAVIHELECL